MEELSTGAMSLFSAVIVFFGLKFTAVTQFFEFEVGVIIVLLLVLWPAVLLVYQWIFKKVEINVV